MVSFFRNVSFDCADPYLLARFWSQVVGHPIDPECRPGDEEVVIEVPDASNLYFQQVPEGKTVKNRIHVCLQPADRRRDDEVARLTDLGAVIVADHREPDGTGWAVMHDPEGNEFCVVRSDSERV